MDAAAQRVPCPVFGAADSGETGAAAALLPETTIALTRQFRPRAGAHGSVILRADRRPDRAAAWPAVGSFLDEVVAV